MRIRRVFVEGLFNIFDHDIPMKMDDRITIIHAPNGFGKTAILRMIDGLFNSRYADLRIFPFAQFGVEFEDDSVLEVSRSTEANDDRRHERADPTRGNGKSLIIRWAGHEPFRLKPLRERDLGFPIEAIDDIVEDLTRVGRRKWRTSSGEVLELDDVLARYGNYFPTRYRLERDEPDWLQYVRKQVPVRFIRTDRLAQPGAEFRRGRAGRTVLSTPTVLTYAEELASNIRSTLTEYAELSQSLDRTFPGRLVEQSPTDGITKKEISQRLAEFEEKRKRLVDAGLLDQERDPQSLIGGTVDQTIDETKAGILAVYVGDVEKKLSVFDTLAAKIDLFKSVINRLFRHKRMVISKDAGMTFTTDAGAPLEATSLSSGEQHEVVMLYELLFKLPPDSLILIDEPEISLHLAWQKQFLQDLTDMTGLSGFDVLLATHSPQIISDRWDLTVELQDTRQLQEATQ